MNRRAMLLVVAISAPILAQPKQPLPSEQKHFSAEDGAVKRPVPVPDDILALLAQDDMVRNAMSDADPPQQSPLDSWFSASVIHLAGPDEKDYVVMSTGKLAGANVDMFWVFVPDAGGYRLVLAAPAFDLEVKPMRTEGHRDIELVSATASVVTSGFFRWDGAHYAAAHVESHKIR